MGESLMEVIATQLCDFHDEMRTLPSTILRDRARVWAANIIKMIQEPETGGRRGRVVREEW